jgi:hypothetical protein
MATESAAQPVTHDSLGLMWALVTRSVGLTAGLAVALLLFAALISMP